MENVTFAEMTIACQTLRLKYKIAAMEDILLWSTLAAVCFVSSDATIEADILRRGLCDGIA